MADCFSLPNAAEAVNFLRGEAKELSMLANGKTECNALWKAADAIEQLLAENAKLKAERDEWKTLGSLANMRAKDYREMRCQRDKAIKERDAAISDIPRACGYCKWYVESDNECVRMFPCNNISGVNTEWEWRGVTDTNVGSKKEEEDAD